jgi:nucleoside 2-deoxyribosyltransferase/adenylate kinase
MRILVTGLSGLDKKKPLQQVTRDLRKKGLDITLFNVGDMMYAENPAIVPGRILDLPIGHLRQLRRTVFRDILACPSEHVIVNSHATFRWRTGLFSAFDFDEIRSFSPTMCVSMVEDIDQTWLRLQKNKSPEMHDYTMKDLFVWREEEILATQLLAQIPKKRAEFLMIPLPDARPVLETLLTRPRLKRAYISFPITNVLDHPRIMADIDRFKDEIKKIFLAFDPFTVKESWMVSEIERMRAGEIKRNWMEVEFEGRKHRLPAEEVAPCVRDINGQIITRDLGLIDQSDLVVAYMPDIDDLPVNSPGVMREITHAAHTTKDVYIIWTSRREASPFIKDMVPNPKGIFPSLEVAVKELQKVAREPRSKG